MAPSSQPMYAKDEKVLCFHGELLYEAKILDSKPVDPNDKKSPLHFLVHYKGWKNTWDDWVPQDRLRKLNDDNRELALQLKKDAEAMRRPSKKSTTNRKSNVGADNSARGSEERHSSVATSANVRTLKRGRDDVEKEEAFHIRPSIRIPVPDQLKGLLVDDWENVTKSLELVAIPHKYPVSAILNDYFDQEMAKRQPESIEASILEEVIAGVREYFNKALGRILLYRFEREQWLNIYKRLESGTDELAGKQPADVYGGEHLLRLFVSMPELIAQTNMDTQSVNRLREELAKMTMWLAKDANLKKYFAADYMKAGPDYEERLPIKSKDDPHTLQRMNQTMERLKPQPPPPVEKGKRRK